MTPFQKLEFANVALCDRTGAGMGAATPHAALVRYDRALAANAEYFRGLIRAVRTDSEAAMHRHFVDGMESALSRAIHNPRKPVEIDDGMGGRYRPGVIIAID
jgi:hypothetical protein